jgi:hypothetical protein
VLFQPLGLEAGQHIIFGGIADFNGAAADFTIFDVYLTWDGKVEDHRDLFPAIRAHESLFHGK